jgi:hypothetical protein
VGKIYSWYNTLHLESQQSGILVGVINNRTQEWLRGAEPFHYIILYDSNRTHAKIGSYLACNNLEIDLELVSSEEQIQFSLYVEGENPIHNV